MKTLLIILMALLTGGSLAQAQPAVPGSAILTVPGDSGDGRWRWIEVEPARGVDLGWVTTSGTATVTMAGGRFRADLTLGPDQAGADVRLVGRIAGKRVTARESLLNTDADPAPVLGVVQRQRIGDTIEERIAFSGGQSGPASFLGLYRRIPR